MVMRTPCPPHTGFGRGVLIAALLLGSGAALPGVELRRGPFLQVPRPDGITIRWRTDTAVHYTSVLRYGKDPDHLSRAVAATEAEIHYPHVRDWQVTLDGLEPETTYYYAVEADRVTLCGADERHFFRTAPKPGTARRLRFLLLGDFGANRPRNDSPAAVLAAGGPIAPIPVRNGFRKFNRGQALDGIILLGDNAYPSGTDEMYQTGLFALYADELCSTPLWPSPGNHDIDGAYEYQFTVNSQGQAGGVPSGSRCYYSADVANLHLVALDPWLSWWKVTTATNHPPWRRQLDWLQRDLQATTQEWIVVVNHFPLYCDGNYNSDNDLLSSLRETLVPVLDQCSVDVFAAGHDHTYQRSYLLAGLTGNSASYAPERHRKSDRDGRAAPIVKHPTAGGGTLYLVAGAAGGTRPQGKFAHPALVPFQTPQGERRGLAIPSSLVIELDGLTLRGWQVDVAGQVLDQFTLQHAEPRAARRPAP